MEVEENSESNNSPMELLDWRQNDKLIFINVYLEGLRQEQVKIVFDEKSIEITVSDKEFNLKVDLAQAVLPKFCIYKVVPLKLEIKMKKDLHRTSKNNAWWKFLCKDGSMPGDPKPIDTKSDDMAALKAALPRDQDMTTKEEEIVQKDSNPRPQIPIADVISRITHDWYQTETHVVIEIRVKKLKEQQVETNFAPNSLTVFIRFAETYAAEDTMYKLILNLSNQIVPEQSTCKILSTKVELKLKKQEGIRWNSLEGSPAIPTSDIEPDHPPTYPTRLGGKDWNKIDTFLDTELEYLKENQDAGDVFSMIYKDADENTRKAMNKSFQESGGTVLSTNWDEISQKKTEPQVD